MRSSFIRRTGVLLAFVLAFGSLTRGLWSQDPAADLIKTADDIVKTVARLRSLDPKAAIAKGVKTREEIARYIEGHVKDNYEESLLLQEGKMLQKLGLIPSTLDYKSFMLKLLTEQVGGYYDPDQKTFFIAGWLPVEQQKPVMVHELTHALQDQYFDLASLQKQDQKLSNDDRVLAHQAIFEGDAMAVMLDYMLEPAGKNFSQLPNLVMVMHSQFSMMDEQFEVFRAAPAYLKEALLFPYGYGATFLQKVRAAKPWAAVDRIYSDLPASTEQIIHPEKYLGERDEPRKIEIEDPSARMGAGWKAPYRNVLGEFSLYWMLRQHMPEEKAKRAAEGWGGDQVLLAEDEKGHICLFFSSVWDTAEDAEEFFAAMKDWQKARFPKAQSTWEAAGESAWIQEGEINSVRRDEKRLTFILGLPESEAQRFKSW